MTYTERLQPWITLSFFAGPILFFVAALFGDVVADSMAWQGIFGQYAGMFLIPVNLTLAYMIGQERPRLGVASAIVGLIGASMIVNAYGSYLTTSQLALLQGFDPRVTIEEVAYLFTTEMLLGGLIGLMVPISYMVLGAGLWLTKVTSRVSAVLIFLAGITFFLGQGVFTLSVIISPLFLLLGLLPIGWKRLTKKEEPLLASAG